jgi:hypothetical protein
MRAGERGAAGDGRGGRVVGEFRDRASLNRAVPRKAIWSLDADSEGRAPGRPAGAIGSPGTDTPGRSGGLARRRGRRPVAHGPGLFSEEST